MQTTKRMVKKAVLAVLCAVMAVMMLFALNTQTLLSAAAIENDGAKKYYTDFETFEEEQEAANAFNEEIAAEGNVLLKNAHDALPLRASENDVSVFGVRSTDLQYGGGGSGGGDSSGAATLQDSLADAGFNVNPSLTTFYSNYEAQGTVPEEAPLAMVAQNADSFSHYSDAAIIVVARAGSEGNDLDTHSVNGNEDVTKHELELTDLEEDLIDYVIGTNIFEKVIVLVNASNPMELGELQYNDDVDAILWMGHPGTSGVMAVGRILNGTVNPSGHLSDMYPADFTKDPTWYNFGDNSQNHYNASTKEFDASYINVRSEDDPDTQYKGYLSVDYEEGIYMGYRWYETADVEGYFDLAEENGAFDSATDPGVLANGGDTYYNTYNGVVYPFGYGLSYTEFEYEVTTSGGAWNGESNITVSVDVTNTGDVAGKDVVELYSSAPYYAGGIEKAAVDLIDFAKTDLLEPGETQTITFTVSPQQLASFDDGIWGDDDINGAYVLDPGDYVLSIRTDSHTVEDSVTFTLGEEAADAEEAAENAVAILYDEATGTRIRSWFSEDDGTYINTTRTAAISTDMDVTTRTDFATEVAGNEYSLYHPTTATVEDLTFSNEALEIMDGQLRSIDGVDSPENNRVSYIDDETVSGYQAWMVDEVPDSWSQATEEEAAARTDGKTAIQLYEMAGLDFDDPKWDTFMNQLTYAEMVAVIGSCQFQTPELYAIGKPASTDADGPAQLDDGTFWASEVVISATWNTELAEKQGWFVGNDSLFLNVNGWYGPGINTHRSPFGGRNFEYYSQDGVHAGKIFAAVTAGAQSKGVHVYAKHFVLNDQEMGRDVYGGICTWLPEQAFRQIYLKNVEISIKQSDLNGTMTAFNRIGMQSSASGNLYIGVLEDEFGFTGVSVTDFYVSGRGGSAWSANRLIRAHIYPLGSFGTGTATNRLYGEYREDANGDGMVWITEEGGEAFESPSQWKAVRDTAMRSLYVAANGNMMHNGVSTDAFTDGTIEFAEGVEPTASVAVAQETFDADIRTVEYSVAGGALPAGLTLNADGSFGGAATEVGTFEVTVQLLIDHYITKDATFTITVTPAFALSATSASVGTSFTSSITSEHVYLSETAGDGGYDTLVYEISDGTLPTGVALDAEGAQLIGTPTAAGDYTFTLHVIATREEPGSSGTTVVTDEYYQDVTISVAGEAGEEVDLEGMIEDLNGQIEDLNGQIEDLEEQIAALENQPETPPTEEEGGCGSSLIGGAALLGCIALAGAGVCIARKRK